MGDIWRINLIYKLAGAIRFLSTGISAAVLGLASFFLLTFPMAYVSHLLGKSRGSWFLTLAVVVDPLSFGASSVISSRGFALCGRWACAAANVIVILLVLSLTMRILVEHGAIIYVLLASPFFAFMGGAMGESLRVKNGCKELWVEEAPSSS